MRGRYTPEGMRRSVLLNLCFVAVALVVGAIAAALRAARGITRQHPLQQGLNPTEEGSSLHSTALNYLVFLRNSRDMFLALTAVSMLVVVPVLGPGTFLFGISARCGLRSRVALELGHAESLGPGCFPGPISLMEAWMPASWKLRKRQDMPFTYMFLSRI